MRKLCFLLLATLVFGCEREDDSSPVREERIKNISLYRGNEVLENFAFAYDQLGRLAQVNNETFEYATNGRVTKSIVRINSDEIKFQYEWDNNGKISGILVSEEDVAKGHMVVPREYKYNIDPEEIHCVYYQSGSRLKNEVYTYYSDDKNKSNYPLIIVKDNRNHPVPYGTYDKSIEHTFSSIKNPIYPIFKKLGFMPIRLMDIDVVPSEYMYESSTMSPFFPGFVNTKSIEFATENTYKIIFNSIKNNNNYPTESICKVIKEDKVIDEFKYVFTYE